MKIVVLDGYTSNPGLFSWKEFEQLGQLTVYDDTVTDDEVVERCMGADVVLSNKRKIPNSALKRLVPQLKYVGIMATGCNVVDLAEARRLGITVTNVPAYSSQAVAQLAMMLLLNVIYRPRDYTPSGEYKAWLGNYDELEAGRPFFELAGKQVGIFGFGNIGRCMAAMCSGMGMTIATCSSQPTEMLPPGTLKMTRDELFATSDVISIHCPLNEETHGIISRHLISLMKPGAILINTSRGALIDEEALAEALTNGKIFGAGLDVLSEEPPNPTNPLIHAPRTLITPHIGWNSTEARQRLMNITLSNLQSWIAGHPHNVVNK